VAAGTVTAFDERRGAGTITGTDGSEHFFHCTRLADGSRTIRVGQAVEFEIAPGRRGDWEAVAVVKVGASA